MEAGRGLLISGSRIPTIHLGRLPPPLSAARAGPEGPHLSPDAGLLFWGVPPWFSPTRRLLWQPDFTVKMKRRSASQSNPQSAPVLQTIHNCGQAGSGLKIDCPVQSPLQLNKIYCGDARKLLPRIQPNSVACSIWSPPYFVGKTYEAYLKSYDAWKTLLRTVIRQHFRIIKPGGFVVINIADILCFADHGMPRIQAETMNQRRSPVTREDVLRAKAKHPDYNRDKLAALLGCSEQTIDRRLNGNNIRGGKYATQTRVKLIGGDIEEWAQAAGFYVYDRRVWVKDPAWQNGEWHSSSYRSVDEFEYLYFLWKPGITTVDRQRISPREWSEWGSRAAWFIPSVRSNGDHEAKFPVELPRRVIKLLTAAGETVLDCFMGSGSSAVAAIQTGRNYIGIDREEKYVILARHACTRATHSIEMAPQDRDECPEPAMLPFASAAGS